MEKNVKNKKDDVLSEMKKVKRYKRDEHKKIEKLSKSQFQKQIVYLEELEKLKVEEQAKYFDNIFDKIYSGKDIESLRKYSLRCIKLTCDPKNNKIHLPYGVLVQKKDNKLVIKLSNNRNLCLFLLLLIPHLFFCIFDLVFLHQSLQIRDLWSLQLLQTFLGNILINFLVSIIV